MTLFTLVFFLFVGVVLIQVAFSSFVFGKFAFLKPKVLPKVMDVPVSVIICAKNEAINLNRFLPYIIEQDYKVFQVVLINDGSSDKTLKVMKRFEKQYSHVKVVNVKPVETFWGNKKYPLTLGIKAASYEHLLFTDADCKPISKQWISHMMANFNNEKTIVLGYGAYAKINRSLLNKIIRFETLTTAISYFSFANLGIPYMGVGRNLAYTKSQFFKVNGFMGHMNVLSGDDDLFVNKAATKTNTAFCFSAESFTVSQPKLTFKDWLIQKRRHITTAKHYKTIHKFLLALLYLTHLLFWVLSITLLYNWYWSGLTAILITLRLATLYTTYAYSIKKLGEKDLLWGVPLLEFFLIFFQLVIFILNKISKPNHWK